MKQRLALAALVALAAPALVVNRGFAERFELVLEAKQFDALDASPRYRLDDAAISLKTVLRRGPLQDASGPSVAFELGALLPAIHGDSGAGASAAPIVSQRWPALTLHLNGAALSAPAKGWCYATGPRSRSAAPAGPKSGRPCAGPEQA